MLHFLKSLVDWFDPQTLKQTPVAQTAWAVLSDSYHTDICLRFRAEEIAVASIYLALESLGVAVPCNSQSRTPWWQVREWEFNLQPYLIYRKTSNISRTLI